MGRGVALSGGRGRLLMNEREMSAVVALVVPVRTGPRWLAESSGRCRGLGRVKDGLG